MVRTSIFNSSPVEKKKKQVDRPNPIIIRSRRLAFQQKQQEVVKENPKYLKNALPKGRRARITKKNPKLIVPKMKRKTMIKRSQDMSLIKPKAQKSKAPIVRKTQRR